MPTRNTLVFDAAIILACFRLGALRKLPLVVFSGLLISFLRNSCIHSGIGTNCPNGDNFAEPCRRRFLLQGEALCGSDARCY